MTRLEWKDGDPSKQDRDREATNIRMNSGGSMESEGIVGAAVYHPASTLRNETNRDDGQRQGACYGL